LLSLQFESGRRHNNGLQATGLPPRPNEGSGYSG